MFPDSRTGHVVRVMTSVRPDLAPVAIDSGGHSPEGEFGEGKRWGFTADLAEDISDELSIAAIKRAL